MGAWGVFDDENDNTHDLWSDFISANKNCEPHNVFKILEKYITKKNISERNCVGMVMYAFRYIHTYENNGSAENFNFGTRIEMISACIPTRQTKGKNDAFDVYKISVAVAKKINKPFLKKVLTYLDVELKNVYEEGWFDIQHRINCINQEIDYINKIITDTYNY